MQKDVARLQELTIRLNKYKDEYYNYNESLISDSNYDALLNELISLEKSTGIVMANSPTQNKRIKQL